MMLFSSFLVEYANTLCVRLHFDFLLQLLVTWFFTHLAPLRTIGLLLQIVRNFDLARSIWPGWRCVSILSSAVGRRRLVGGYRIKNRLLVPTVLSCPVVSSELGGFISRR